MPMAPRPNSQSEPSRLREIVKCSSVSTSSITSGSKFLSRPPEKGVFFTLVCRYKVGSDPSPRGPGKYEGDYWRAPCTRLGQIQDRIRSKRVRTPSVRKNNHRGDT